MDSRAKNRQVQFKRLTAGQDEIGQPTQVWADLVQVRANVRYLNGIETIKAGAETAVSKASIRIAYRTNLTTADRAYLGTTEFRITAVLPDEAGKKHTDVTCEAIT
jgi:SPP1 family predicted phage head-tail adaptor